MARPLAVIALLATTIAAAFAAPSASLTPEDAVKNLDRRRTPQQCLVLGFVTAELACSTCEQLKDAFEADGISHVSKVVYDDNDVYYQCKSCCAKGRLEGDAMRLPDEAPITVSSSSSSSTTTTTTSQQQQPQQSYLPYELPPAHSYWRARLEISTFSFEQESDRWHKLWDTIPMLYPLPANRARYLKEGAQPPKAAYDPVSGRKVQAEEALVELLPIYQRLSYAHLYAEGQQLPVGNPETGLTQRGEEPIMSLDITNWDANKVEEFLNNTISGSMFRVMAEEKKKAAAEKKQKGSENDEL